MDLNILNARGLGCGPVNTGSRRGCRNSSQVNNQVPNLAKENVGGSPPLVSTTLILITINYTQTREVGTGFYDSRRVGVTDQLSEVVIDNRSGDEIGSCWEVDNGRSGRRSHTR